MILITFFDPKKTFHAPLLPVLSTGHYWSVFCHYSLLPFIKILIKEIIQHVGFVLGSLTSHNAFDNHPRCCVNLWLISSNCWILFHSIAVLPILYHTSIHLVDGRFVFISCSFYSFVLLWIKLHLRRLCVYKLFF